MYSITKMLEDFTCSYIEKEKELFDFKIGFEVDDNWWNVTINKDGKYKVDEGKPEEQVFYFKTDLDTFTKIYKQDMTAVTAMGAAKSTDSTPLEADLMEGATLPAEFNFFNFLFRYFILGTPEVVKFSKEHARIVHGGYSIPFLYEKGLRTAWYRIEKGMIINEDPSDQTNPFKTLIIAINGEGIGRIGNKVLPIKSGELCYIEENVPHTIWTESDFGLEFIIIMFGDKA